MFTRVFGPCLLFLSVLIVGFSTVTAQAPLDLPVGALMHRSAVGNPITSEQRGGMDPQASHLAAQGAPGLSFRYVKTFGETGVAYPSDANHLNYPWGITTVGNSLWVAESWGLRLLNYTNTGTFVRAVGNAGSNLFDDTDVFYMADIAVDAQNNVWIAADYSKVIKADQQGNVLLVLNGAGSAGDDFRSPVGIALDGAGNVYVSDGAQWWTTEDSHQRIVIFDAAGNYLATIGERDTAGSANTQFRGPRHITIDQNLLYVADSGNHRIQIFDIAIPTTPTFVATLGITGEAGDDNQHLNEPSGVAVDANFIYVADTFNQRIQLFQRSNRHYVATIGGEWGVTNAQLSDPSDVAVDNAGNIFVADFVNTRVQQFNANRQYVRTYGVTRTPYISDGSHYNRPFGVDVGADGSIYIAEGAGHRVVKLNAAGVPQWTAGQAGLKNDWDSLDGSFSEAVDVAVGPTNRVYVADRYGRRVQIFNADGTLFHILYGNDQVNFEWVSGLDVDANGNLYVTNDIAHALYIFDAKLNHIATIGEPGVAGDDNAHLRDPWGVAVDNSGAIFVAERSNYQVKKCTRSDAGGSCIPWIGEIGVDYNDFGYFGAPHRLAVDSQGNLYVSHEWYRRVDIFDAAGAYLTSVGGSWGENSGQFREPRGVAVGPNGDLYVADIPNHRIQKFSPGVPSWRQVNINGFGDVQTRGIMSLNPAQGMLYASTSGWDGTGARRLMRSSDGQNWREVIGNGAGSIYNTGLTKLAEFKGNLYVGTFNFNWNQQQSEGGELWRSPNGLAWSAVVTGGFGTVANDSIDKLLVFDDHLYAATYPPTNTHGFDLWRSSTGDAHDWTRVVTNGFGDPKNWVLSTLEVFSNTLYAGISNEVTGGELWRSTDGVQWTQVYLDGFGNANNDVVGSLEVFRGQLYAGLRNFSTGGEIWRSTDGNQWSKVVSGGLGNVNNARPYNLTSYAGQLYVFFDNQATGMEVWRSPDGVNWQQISTASWGDSNNTFSMAEWSATVFAGQLYVGTWNEANGGELWMYTDATTGQATRDAGGSLYNPTNGISLTLPANAVTTTVTLAFQKVITPSHSLPADKVGLRYFTVTAQDEAGNAVNHFTRPYTLTLTYTDEALLQAGAEEATLTCFYLDEAAQQWKDLPSDPNPVTNQVACHADHLTEFALVAGKPVLSQTLFLPVIRRGN